MLIFSAGHKHLPMKRLILEVSIAKCAAILMVMLILASMLQGCSDQPTLTIHVRSQLQEAVDNLAQLVPAEASELKRQKYEIVDFLMNLSEPRPNSTLQRVQFSGSENSADLPNSSVEVSLSPCQQAEAVVVFDAVSVVMGMVRFNMPSKGISFEAWVNSNPQTADALLPNIEKFGKATRAEERAGEFFEIAKKVFTSNGFSAVFSALRKSMTSWWDWVKLSVSVIAQILLWFGTASEAFIAQLTFELLSIGRLSVDFDSCAKVCEKHTIPLLF